MWQHANDGIDLPYGNRRQAGRLLAASLRAWEGRGDVVVLGLLSGGVPVAAEVAATLGAPLDIMVARKLGVPGHEELVMGAIASGGGQVFNREVLDALNVHRSAVDHALVGERRELARRERVYRGGLDPPDLAGRRVIVVDDGMTTGAVMRAAIRSTWAAGAAAVVVAVPVAPSDTVEVLRREGVEVICLATPEPFLGVGRWYLDFSKTTAAEVVALLARARGRQPLERTG